LKKINYIEADIEIHKQILVSIPSDNRQDIEKTIKIIAAKKEEITGLRQEIKKIDPEEDRWITIFEKAVNDFKKISSEKKFRFIAGMNADKKCSLLLADKSATPCLIKACEENGDWTIITMEGKISHFKKDDVAEKPVQQSIIN